MATQTSFDQKTWKERVAERLTNWRAKMSQLGAHSVYAFLSTATLWPVVEAAQSGHTAALMALGGVLGGVGGNLIANGLQTWKDEADAVHDIEAGMLTDPTLRDELDALLDALDTFPAAAAGLSQQDQDWFAQTLRTELERIGNLPRFEAKLIGTGIIVQGDFHGNVQFVSSAPPAPPHGLREAYLHWLIEQVSSVPLTGVDPKSVREETRRDLDLAAVYTALMTQSSEEAELREFSPDQLRQRSSALAMLNAKSRLALLGDPGSGKSTFVNFVALCMAGELLGRTEANLKTLRAPVPNDDEYRLRDEEEKPQPWDHGPLIPLHVVLREFVARKLASLDPSNQVDGDNLWQFIIGELPETLQDFAEPLRTELLETGGLLLLDGLDEVPEADERRVQVKAAVEQFAAAFPKVHVLATSRIYAYQHQAWKLRDFAEATLAPFGQTQIQKFVERWYAFVGHVRRLTEADAQGRAVLLNNAITRNPRLFELATRPLLLTLMSSLHAWRGGTLPDQREELYDDAVDLLLDQWEQQKSRRKADGSYEVVEPSLVEWLQVDQKVIRQFLNRIAFEAHRDQQTLVGTADIEQGALVNGLMQLNLNPDARPTRLVEYLRDRAGVLEPRGVGIYAFPHRTFQEYLAACYLTEQDDFPENVADLLRAEPNRWREVTLLAGAKAVRGATSNAWNLADALCFADPPTDKLADETGYWGALLAGQVLIENRSLERVAERNQSKLERIRGWLTCTLTQEALPPIDRALSGDALARIGDPRFREDAWWLPNEDMLGFVEIPAGEFVMGSDKGRDSLAYDEEEPQHELSLPRFYIARYPVTVAQFRKFGRGQSLHAQVRTEFAWPAKPSCGCCELA